MNKEPLFGCCQCYEDYSYPAHDLVVVDGELWCDNCFMESDMAWEKNLTTADFPTYVPEYEKTINALRAENKMWREAEKSLSDAYLRIREIVGAFDTPKAPSPDAVWSHTENVVRGYVDRAESAEAEVNKIAKRRRDADDKLKVAVEALEKVKEYTTGRHNEKTGECYDPGMCCLCFAEQALAKIGGDDE